MRHGAQRPQCPDRVGFRVVRPAVAAGALSVRYRAIRPASSEMPAATAGGLVVAVAKRAPRPLSWARASAIRAVAFLRRAWNLVQVWAERRRQRRELLDYLAQDHRAVADL